MLRARRIAPEPQLRPEARLGTGLRPVRSKETPGRQQHNAADSSGVTRCDHASDAIAKCPTNKMGRTTNVVDHACDIGRQVVQRETVEFAAARPHASRIHANALHARVVESSTKGSELLGARASHARQHDNGSPLSEHTYLEAYTIRVAVSVDNDTPSLKRAHRRTLPPEPLARPLHGSRVPAQAQHLSSEGPRYERSIRRTAEPLRFARFRDPAPASDRSDTTPTGHPSGCGSVPRSTSSRTRTPCRAGRTGQCAR